MTLIFKIITILAEVNPKYKDEISPSILGLLKSWAQANHNAQKKNGE